MSDLRPTYEELLDLVPKQQRQIEALQAEVARLTAALDTALRAGKRQAAPFGKGPPQPDPKTPGRQSGDAHGTHGHRPPPDQIHETHDAALPAARPHCGGGVVETARVEQFQTDIPASRSCGGSASRWAVASAAGSGCRGDTPCRPPTPRAPPPSWMVQPKPFNYNLYDPFSGHGPNDSLGYKALHNLARGFFFFTDSFGRTGKTGFPGRVTIPRNRNCLPPGLGGGRGRRADGRS